MQAVTFPFEDKDIRVVQDDSGEPLFVGKDVCDLLGHANHRQAFKQHCKDAARRLPGICGWPSIPRWLKTATSHTQAYRCAQHHGLEPQGFSVTARHVAEIALTSKSDFN